MAGSRPARSATSTKARFTSPRTCTRPSFRCISASPPAVDPGVRVRRTAGNGGRLRAPSHRHDRLDARRPDRRTRSAFVRVLVDAHRELRCIVTTSVRQSLVDLLSKRAAAQPHARAYTFLDGGEIEGAHADVGDARRSAPTRSAPRSPSRVPAGARVLLLFPPGLDFDPGVLRRAIARPRLPIPAYPPAGARMDRTCARRLRGMIADAGVTLVVSTRAVRAKSEAFTAVIPELSRASWLIVDELDRRDRTKPSTRGSHNRSRCCSTRRDRRRIRAA